MYIMNSLINTPKVVSSKFIAILETMQKVEKKLDPKNLKIKCLYPEVLAKKSLKQQTSHILKIKRIEKKQHKNFF